jgi:hypothetical protein
MQVLESGQTEALLRYDVHQKAKLDIRGDDVDLRLRLHAKLRAEVEAREPDVDRDAAARTVLQISESIKLRMRLEAEGEETEPLRGQLEGLAERFTAAVTELAESFASPEGGTPAESLVSGLRVAFAELIGGIRELFLGPVVAPMVNVDPPSPGVSDPGMAETAPSEPESSQGSESSPVATVPEAAEEEPASSGQRLYSLRHDLHLRLSWGMRVLLRQLAGLPGEGGAGEAGEAAGMARELRARFELRERLELSLIDLRA